MRITVTVLRNSSPLSSLIKRRISRWLSEQRAIRRKDFGKVISQHPHISPILTAYDSNFEDPSAICTEIAKHINRPATIIVDRALAIKTALSKTKTSDDAVIIAGKGDAFQLVNGERTAYAGDRAIASQYL